MTLVDDVFRAGGLLARDNPRYQPRPGQIQLAHAVERALREQHHLLAEGPTGTGKTFAYCVPAIEHAVRTQTSVLLVTGNISLQEQLMKKDLPYLARVLPTPFRFVLRKGITNYVCRDRLEDALQQGAFDFGTPSSSQRKELLAWAERTRTGDRSELPFVPPPTLWRKVSTTTDECLGKLCGLHEECFNTQARRAAEGATLIVANYHLLFAHLQVKAGTGSDIVLPKFGAVILDEAHKAPDVARDFFGARANQAAVELLLQDLEGISVGRALPAQIRAESTAFFGALALHAQEPTYKARLRTTDAVPQWKRLHGYVRDAAGALRSASESSESEEDTLTHRKAAVRAELLAQAILEGMTLADPNQVYFVETEQGRAGLRSKPVSVQKTLHEMLLADTPSVVATSATLSVGGSMSFYARELGAWNARTLSVRSPFNLRDQALLVVPNSMPPDPNDPAFPDACLAALSDAIRMARGRTLGLFTSNKALDRAHEHLAGGPYRVLRQGEAPVAELVRAFTEDVHSVLLGTHSLWAGVDVPGEALSCVVMDRLPFPSPEDPVMDALVKTPADFVKHSVPRAVIEFKQGFGRLIRTTTDRGVVVLLDRRILTKNYGRMFRNAVGPVPVSEDLADVARFLDR